MAARSDFIVELDLAATDPHKKAKRALMPIADVKLVHQRLSMQPNTSHMRLMIGKASQPRPVHGKLGRCHSALPT
jgi:hypothetical protein